MTMCVKENLQKLMLVFLAFVLSSGFAFADSPATNMQQTTTGAANSAISNVVKTNNLAPDNGAKQLWQLMDYVAVDYGGAVNKGVVVSEAEYAEMLDFTNNAAAQSQSLPANDAKQTIIAAIADLRTAVLAKADAAEVKRLAHLANKKLIAAYPITVAPMQAPDLARGKTLYQAQCASCHGVNGDGNGALAANLEPKPIAFTDAERAHSRSLMALFQVVSQGVDGTSMPSFATLNDDDRWALAFL